MTKAEKPLHDAHIFKKIREQVQSLWKVVKNPVQIIRQISDKIIEKKITDAKNAATLKINALYADYKRNVLVTIVLNVFVIAVTLIAHFFFTINAAVICIVSVIPTIMMVRNLYRTAKTVRMVALNINHLIQIDNNDTVIILDITYWNIIQIFSQKMRLLKSVPTAIKESIRFFWRHLYTAITNDVTRTLHSAGKKIEIIKSPEEIEESIVQKFYPLVCNYLLHSILYKIAALFAFYGIFLLLLKQYVFAHTVHMGALQVMLYPFTVALPAVLSVIKNGMGV